MPTITDLARELGYPEWILRDVLGMEPVEDDEAPVEGTPISVREAARKYDVPPDTISRWVSHPDLRIRVLHDPGRPGVPKLVDEHDLYLVIRAWKSDSRQGKRAHVSKAAEELRRAVGEKVLSA